MMELKVIESKKGHVFIVARQLRKQSADELVNIGINAKRELIEAFLQSTHRKSLLKNGRIVAMGGAIGTLASTKCFVWVAITEEGLGLAKTVIRTLRESIELLFESYEELITNVPDKDTDAVRFVTFLGFRSCGEVMPGMTLYSRKKGQSCEK